MRVFFVQDSDLGWDNVVALYSNEEAAQAHVDDIAFDTVTMDYMEVEDTYFA